MVILNPYYVYFHVVKVTSLGFDFLLKVAHNLLCLATYKCQKCTEEFTCLLKLAVHLNGEHERINNRSQCPICPKNYHKNFTKVTNHIKSVHLNVKKKCKICQDIVPFSDYATHIEAHGNEIKCDLCDYTTKLRRNLNKHLWQMHTKREKIHQCDQCHQNFILPYQLKDHKEKIHEGIVRKLHSCDQCEKKFRYPYEVKIHVEKVHLGKDFSTSGQK